MKDEIQQRAAFVKKSECKPKKCHHECKKSCPVNMSGKKCIEVKSHYKISFISEEMCIGCGICVKRCPFKAIQIINIPKSLNKDIIHRFGPNTFKLHRLPIPRVGKILGLVGTNGIGKSTALSILSGFKPNLGNFKSPPDWENILKYFRGSELQSYFTRILEDNLKTVTKPQNIDRISKKLKGRVSNVFKRKKKFINECQFNEIINLLELNHLMDRNVEDLSGGEVQRLSIAIVCMQSADIYVFDEPSSYLDVRQRLNAAKAIRGIIHGRENTDNSAYILLVEHDLSILDYLSDYVCCLYGKQGAYGVVTSPFSVREGVNHFLAGYIPTENIRFRNSELSFKFSDDSVEYDKNSARIQYNYPKLTKTRGTFKLSVSEGNFSDSEIIVMLGQNGTGKSTFIKLLAGMLKPDEDIELPQLKISYKPQNIVIQSVGTVRSILNKKIRAVYTSPSFISDIIKPLKIDEIIDNDISNLSGGELQRVALTLCLGKKADLYLIDEPSAYLDCEQRIVASKAIKKYIVNSKKTAFVVEHDFIMATYLADKIIVFDGKPGINCIASSQKSLVDGMNIFLKSLNITFRRDPSNYRPRINKFGSQKDQEQKNKNDYFSTK